MAKQPRRDRATELYTMASDLTVSDADLARHAAALTKRMNPPTQAFVIHFAGVFRMRWLRGPAGLSHQPADCI